MRNESIARTEHIGPNVLAVYGDEDADTDHWRHSWIRCGACGHVWVGAFPNLRYTGLECPECGHYAGAESHP